MLAKDMRFNKIEKMFQAQGKVKVQHVGGNQQSVSPFDSQTMNNQITVKYFKPPKCQDTLYQAEKTLQKNLNIVKADTTIVRTSIARVP